MAEEFMHLQQHEKKHSEVVEEAIVQISPDAGFQKVGISSWVQPRFDSVFFRDVLVTVGIFVLTAVCLLFNVPFIGDAWSLLLGPLVGLILSLKHRPPR